jgi:hypothetical protein
MLPGHVTISWLNFEHLHWSGSADLWGTFSFLGSPTAPNQDCMVDVEECTSPQEFKRFTVAAALWGQALSCKRRTPSHLVNNPGILRNRFSVMTSLPLPAKQCLKQDIWFHCCAKREDQEFPLLLNYDSGRVCCVKGNRHTDWRTSIRARNLFLAYATLEDTKIL